MFIIFAGDMGISDICGREDLKAYSLIEITILLPVEDISR